MKSRKSRKSRRRRGGMGLTGNDDVDGNVYEVARNEQILNSLGGSKKRKKPKKKTYKK
jgi:hypothetical protein